MSTLKIMNYYACVVLNKCSDSCGRVAEGRGSLSQRESNQQRSNPTSYLLSRRRAPQGSMNWAYSVSWYVNVCIESRLSLSMTSVLLNILSRFYKEKNPFSKTYSFILKLLQNGQRYGENRPKYRTWLNQLKS